MAFGPAALQPPILRIFLALGILFGACYALILPPLQAPDEFAHFYRAYGIAEGSCVASTLTAIPVSLREMAAAFQPNMEEERRIEPDYILAFLHKPLEDGQRKGVTNEAANMYSCFPYLPSAIGIEAGRIVGASPAALLYLSRLGNLAAYLALVALALRQLPGFQLPLLAVALMPMALSQAASASWDGVAYATAFFLFAYILRLAWDPQIHTLATRHYLLLGGTVVVAALCKADLWLTPLLVLVPAPRFGGMRRKWLVLLGAIGLGLLVIAGWNYLNREDIARWVEHVKDRQIYLSDNAAFLVHQPGVFAATVGRTWAVHGIDFAAEFIGKLGWLAVTLPAWSIGLYFLLLVMLAATSEVRPTAANRVLCVGLAITAISSVFIGMWCAETTRPHTLTVLQGTGLVAGVQGRYFIPFALPLLLGISAVWRRINRKWLPAAAAVTIFAVNAVAVQEIRGTYYLTGSVSPYENKLVRRAGSSPEDGKVFLVRAGKRHWIIFGSWIVKHGYRWPEELLVLTPEQFATIPEGKLIGEQ